jgi:hypothetical protein
MLNLPRRQAGLFQHLLEGSSNYNLLLSSADPETSLIMIRTTLQQALKQVQGKGSG